MATVSQVGYRRQMRSHPMAHRRFSRLRIFWARALPYLNFVNPVVRQPLGRAIPVGAVLLLITLGGGTAMLMERTRATALHAAAIALQNSTLVVESTINRQFLQVDQLLASLPALLAPVVDQRGQIDPTAASQLLGTFNFQTFVFRDIILVRPDGAVWARARPNPRNRPLPVSPSELINTSHPGSIVVAGPARNPITGDWALFLARPINLPGAGLLEAVAEVPLPLITELLAPVGQIAGVHISVERRNGQLLASQPHDELSIGKQVTPLIVEAQTTGVAFVVRAKLAAAPTIEVARPTLYGDILVALTLDVRTALADWTRDRNHLLGAFTLVALMILAIAVTLHAALRQRERVEAERSQARAMLDNAIESMTDGFVMWDAEDRLVACNQQYRDMYKISAPFIHPGTKFEDIIREGALLGQYPQATDDIETFVEQTVRWHRSNRPPMERELPDGHWILITERLTPDGGVVGIRTDITHIKKASASLAAANARVTQAIAEVQLQNTALVERDHALRKQNLLFDAALNNMSQGLLMTDSEQKLIVCNNRFLQLFGLEPGAVKPGMTTAEVFETILLVGGMEAEVVRILAAQQEGLTSSQQSGMFVAASAEGRALTVSQRPLSDGGWVATYEDATEQRRAEERIRFAAHHDALTRLPNRVLFRTTMDEALRTLNDGRGDNEQQGLALLYLDLDKFKDVNDTLGHPVGDALLAAAARRLQNCVRETDIVARLGGDEFAIVYVSSDLPRTAKILGQRIIDTLSAPYDLAGHNVVVGASVGIAIATESTVDADTLLKNADMALYQAKAKGRGTCCLFETDMEAQLHARLAIEEDLRGALQRQELEVLYQPLFDLGRDRVTGFEALLRWNHATRGIVMPMQFIHLAEEIGLINSIGAWVLERACLDAALLPSDIKVAVNLSPAQLRSGDIVDIVARALATSGVHPSRLELEITETALLKNNEATVALLLRLRKLGLRIALDDFGTGYSSLSYLRSFPFDKIKIDQSFVREMATRHDSAAIVSSVVGLANKLNMRTTAEGVETIDQLHAVRELGCSEAQGYLFGVPRGICDVLDFFAESTAPVESPSIPSKHKT